MAARRAGDAGGTPAAAHEPGRAAAAFQRGARRNEPGGPAAGDAVPGGALRQLAAPAAGGAAGHYWLVAGERAQRPADAPEHAVRPVLHSELFAVAGPEDLVEDGVGGDTGA